MRFQVTPFTVIIDSNEQKPWRFTGLHSDSATGKKLLLVDVKQAKLKTGDYSIEGFESRICVERKSKSDLFGTVSPKSENGERRKRFERELERMAEMDFGAVVVEASLMSCFKNPPQESQFSAKSLYRSVVAWEQRFGVHWWFLPTVDLAMQHSFRSLERFWRDIKEGKQ